MAVVMGVLYVTGSPLPPPLLMFVGIPVVASALLAAFSHWRWAS
jgi:hypothetical protein